MADHPSQSPPAPTADDEIQCQLGRIARWRRWSMSSPMVDLLGAEAHPAVVARLAESDIEVWVRQRAVVHPALPREVMERLADERTFAIWLLDNPALPGDLIGRLVRHDSALMRRALMHANCPPRVLAAGARAESETLRALAAAHPGLGAGTMQRLCKEANPAVVEALMANPALAAAVQRRMLDSVRASRNWHLIETLAANPGLDADVAVAIARESEGPAPLRAIAANPAVPLAALVALVERNRHSTAVVQAWLVAIHALWRRALAAGDQGLARSALVLDAREMPWRVLKTLEREPEAIAALDDAGRQAMMVALLGAADREVRERAGRLVGRAGRQR